MKKTLALIIALLMVVTCFVACSKEEEDGGNNNTPPVVSTPNTGNANTSNASGAGSNSTAESIPAESTPAESIPVQDTSVEGPSVEDDPTLEASEDTGSIVGTWEGQMDIAKMLAMYLAMIDETGTFDSFSPSAAKFTIVYTFNADGTYAETANKAEATTAINSALDQLATFMADNGNVTKEDALDRLNGAFNIDDFAGDATGTYTISGNTLAMSADDGEEVDIAISGNKLTMTHEMLGDIVLTRK